MLVISEIFTLCPFPHYLSIAASEPWPFPALWLHKVHTRVTALEHLHIPRAETEATHVLRDLHCCM